MEKLRKPLLALAGLSIAGTLGFVVFEGLGPVDALYLTAVTISTVGYGDIVPVSAAGKLFTVALIVFGAGTGLYLLGAVAETVLEGSLGDLLGRKAMLRDIAKLESHVILCGYGRFGRAVAEELVKADDRLVVVDVDPSIEPDLKRSGAPYLIGSALSDEVLDQAGLGRARALVVATASDSDNVFIVLSASERNPGIRIHARAETEAGNRRLRLAGAHHVISAYQSGGARIAASILRPSVVDFYEISAFGRDEEAALEEIRIAPGSSLVGKEIAELERERPRLRVVAIRSPDGPMRIAPAASTAIAAGDFLVAFGDRPSLAELAQMAPA